MTVENVPYISSLIFEILNDANIAFPTIYHIRNDATEAIKKAANLHQDLNISFPCCVTTALKASEPLLLVYFNFKTI